MPAPFDACQLHAPDRESLLPVPGIALGAAAARIKNWERDDVLLVACARHGGGRRVHAEPLLRCAGHRVPRASRCRARDVLRARHQRRQRQRGHRRGRTRAASAPARRSRELLDCAPEQVLPFSTGVIMEPLPVERIDAALPAALADARRDALVRRRRGDHDDRHRAEGRVPPAVDRRPAGDRDRHRQGRRHDPAEHGDDARLHRDRRPIDDSALEGARARAADASFNRVTVDGDTSTNDSFVIAAPAAPATRRSRERWPIRASGAVQASGGEVARELAQAIVRDGEGATKFITIRVEGGAADDEDAPRRVRRSRTRRWSRPRSSRPTRTSGGISARSAMPASTTSIPRTSTFWLDDVLVVEARRAPRATARETARA